MTIRDRELDKRFTAARDYDHECIEIINGAFDKFQRELRDAGFKAEGDDRAYNLAAEMFRYVDECNPHTLQLTECKHCGYVTDSLMTLTCPECGR